MRTYLIFILIAGYTIASAQDMQVCDQYFPEHEILNPALTGYENCYSVSIHDHHQWPGMKASPNTQTVFARGRFAFPGAVNYHGLGLMVTRDQNGSFRNLEADLHYAYHVCLSDVNKTIMSLGLSAAVSQVMLDEREFNNYNNDPLIGGARLSAWNPDLSLGIVIYNQSYYAGVSAFNLLPALSFVTNPVTADKNQRIFVAIAGIRMKPRKSDIEFEPSVALHYMESLYSRVDINLKGYYRQSIWLGISLRKYLAGDLTSNLSLLPSVGISIGNFEIAYSYGLGFSSIQRRSYGSHYLMLKWKLCRESRGTLPCPAYN
jgi:type IX secretion system PorP/SprF family membrane protein